MYVCMYAQASVWYHATRSYLHLTKLKPAGKCVVSRDPKLPTPD